MIASKRFRTTCMLLSLLMAFPAHAEEDEWERQADQDQKANEERERVYEQGEMDRVMQCENGDFNACRFDSERQIALDRQERRGLHNGEFFGSDDDSSDSDGSWVGLVVVGAIVAGTVYLLHRLLEPQVPSDSANPVATDPVGGAPKAAKSGATPQASGAVTLKTQAAAPEQRALAEQQAKAQYPAVSQRPIVAQQNTAANLQSPEPGTSSFEDLAWRVVGALFACALAIGLLFLACTWSLFRKAGVSGWKALIPVYNWWLFFAICGLPGWLALVPGVNAAAMLVAPFDLARRFGRSDAFGLGLLFAGIIFYPILAFGGSRFAPPKPPSAA